ncbi:MAG: PQQ-dependent sugar dehydrogenase [Myxococcales bacterium]|nr:PQQ-dependent sugar dehydrogenase [Myxococcales bacterium]
MNTALPKALTFLAFLLAESPAFAEVETIQTKEGVEVRVDDVVGGLSHPWGMDFLPDGRLLVTERNAGTLRILKPDGTLSAPLKNLPAVHARGQGGMMDVAVHPEFEENRLVYVSFAKPSGEGRATTALGRGRLEEDGLEDFRVIFEQRPAIDGSKHFGNRIVFSPDGEFLYFALGERFQFDPAQDLSNHLGAVVRLRADGATPPDNPFVDREGAAGEIWSYGHRNIEAMAFRPRTNDLWVAEMGPLGGDELNRIVKGGNYGWPIESWGDNYDGSEIPDPAKSSKFRDAARVWSPVISPSGMIFYGGDMFPSWRGSALIGGLSDHSVVRLAFEGSRVRSEERLPLPARIRDVDEAPDGSIYVLTDQSDGHVWRLSNMEKETRRKH